MVDNNTGGASASSDDGIFKEQERWLPIANVGRIMKQTLPPNAKISKEAKETMQECVSEFISFVTSEASEKCKKERRKTVNGDDVCWALGTLGFDDYAGPLRRYLQRYREAEGDRANQDQKASNGNDNTEDQEREEPSTYRYNLQPAPGRSGSSARPFLDNSSFSKGVPKVEIPLEKSSLLFGLERKVWNLKRFVDLIIGLAGGQLAEEEKKIAGRAKIQFCEAVEMEHVRKPLAIGSLPSKHSQLARGKQSS